MTRCVIETNAGGPVITYRKKDNMTNTARKIGELGEPGEGRQTVYSLTPPYNGLESVVCSKAIGWTGEDKPGTFSGGMFGGNSCELLVFPGTVDGISDFGEIGGSYQCPGGDEEALRDMGYTIRSEPFDASVERFKLLDLD
jgi:hypothetical protein